jgi:hypothetical protein
MHGQHSVARLCTGVEVHFHRRNALDEGRAMRHSQERTIAYLTICCGRPHTFLTIACNLFDRRSIYWPFVVDWGWVRTRDGWLGQQPERRSHKPRLNLSRTLRSGAVAAGEQAFDPNFQTPKCPQPSEAVGIDGCRSEALGKGAGRRVDCGG